MNRDRPAVAADDDDDDGRARTCLVNFCISYSFEHRKATLRALVTVDRIRDETKARRDLRDAIINIERFLFLMSQE